MKNEDLEKILNQDYLRLSSETFLQDSRVNSIAGKIVFFTQGLIGNKYNQYQIVGNFGGRPQEIEIDSDTDFIIIANSLIEEFEAKSVNPQINIIRTYLQKRVRNRVTFLTEKSFLEYSIKRCSINEDDVTMSLLRKTL